MTFLTSFFTSAPITAVIASFLFFGNRAKHLRSFSLLSFLYFASSIPKPITNFKTRLPPLWFALWCLITAAFITYSPAIVVDVYFGLITWIGPLYFLAEGLQIFRVLIFASQTLVFKVNADEFYGQGSTWKIALLVSSLSLYCIAGWLTWALSSAPEELCFVAHVHLVWGSCLAFVVILGVAVIAETGTLFDAAALAATTSYCMWRACGHSPMFDLEKFGIPVTISVQAFATIFLSLFVIGSALILDGHIKLSDDGEEDDRSGPAKAIESYLENYSFANSLDIDSVVYTLLVPLLTYVLSGYSGSFALPIAAAEIVAVLACYGLWLYQEDFGFS